MTETATSRGSLYDDVFRDIEFITPDVFDIFNIAHVLTEEGQWQRPLHALLAPSDAQQVAHTSQEDTPEEEKEVSRLSGELAHIDSMKSILDLPHLLKKQFMWPDEIFDQKLSVKDLLVHRHKDKEPCLSWDSYFKNNAATSKEALLSRQQTYVLMDVSGSTENHKRDTISKAISLAFLRNNNKQKGHIYFRTFNQDVGPLLRATCEAEFKHILNAGIISAIPDGGTNIQRALDQAMRDIMAFGLERDTEILLITDGLALVDPEAVAYSELAIKINCVKIGEDGLNLLDQEVTDLFNQRYEKQLEYISSNATRAEAKRKEAQFKKFHKKDRAKIGQHMVDEMRQSLVDLCEQSKGLFIEIPDIPKRHDNRQRQIHYVQEEIARIQDALALENQSYGQRQRWLQQAISLKSFLNYLRKGPSITGEDKEKLSQADEELEQLLAANEQLMEDVLDQDLLIRMKAPKDMEKLSDVPLSKILHLLFKKLRHVVFAWR